MLKLIDVKKIYSTKVGDVAAMNGITVEFPDTGMVFINGKSGSGKTTLLNVVGGLDGFDSGEIIIDGKNFSTFTPSDYDSYRNTFVGFIFQEYNLLPDYTVEKNIMLANELQGKETPKGRVEELMAEFDIAGLGKRKISELSGGQKQRVAIVRSLVKDPKIIMADEPTGALDSVTGIQVVETLKSLSKDKLIIVVSHDLELAEKYADRIIRIVDGQIVEDITITDTEITGNLHTDANGLTVKTGSDLNPHETEELLKAIREKKKISFTEKVMIRKKEATKEVKDSKVAQAVKLINSKMKLSSAALLGVKSLGVKPGRLIFTVLLSVVAFAIFGIFDTIASYNDAKTVQNVLKKADYQGISVYQRYEPDSPYYYDTLASSSNIAKFSQAEIDKLSQESGYNFRPVYDFKDAELTDLISTYNITKFTEGGYSEGTKIEIPRNQADSMGALYYLPEATGFVEFKDKEIEFTEIDGEKYATTIDKNGFNLRLVTGNLPKFKATKDSANDNEVAVSKYLAETILYWAGGNKDERYMDLDRMIGATLEVAGSKYYVTGVYDTGAIPQKYDELKSLPKMSENSLGTDFRTYLSAGLYSTFIVGEGYTDYVITNKKVNAVEKQRIPGYYAQNQEYQIIFDNTAPYTLKAGQKKARFYNVDDLFVYDKKGNRTPEKIIMFEEARNQDIQLADYEVLVSIEYLNSLYNYEKTYAEMSLDDTIKSYSYYFNDPDYVLFQRAKTAADGKMREGLKTYINNLRSLIGETGISPSYIKNLQITISDKYESKFFKVVGVYTGVDTDINNHASASTVYPIAMTTKGLESIYVNPNQGLYGRVIAPLNTTKTNTKYLAERMTAEDTRLIWYNNNALTLINEGGKMVTQFANLFLYAAIVLALFSIFMLYNYISASIVAKKRSIGVLRALGSGCKDIVSMFITESLIIAIVNGILASFVAAAGCVLVNMYIRNIMNLAIDFALYDVRQVVIIIITSILTAVASSIIPIIKISKEKPVNLIREL